MSGHIHDSVMIFDMYKYIIGTYFTTWPKVFLTTSFKQMCEGESVGLICI